MNTLLPKRFLAGVLVCGLAIVCFAPQLGAADAYEKQLQAEAAARAKDLAWTPTHHETKLIQVGKKGVANALNNFCLDHTGNILACYGGKSRSAPTTAKAPAAEIQVLSPDGKLLKQWPMPTQPQAICVNKDGTIYVGGGGKVYKLSNEGKVLITADTPVLKAIVPARDTAVLRKKLEDSAKECDPKLTIAQVKKTVDEQIKYLEERKAEITGIAVTEQDLFLACPSPSDFTYDVYRFSLDLANPQKVLTGLRGCCNQMDIQSRDGKLWVAHNARHKVECYDREGKQLVEFGTFDRKKAECFGGCCEPKNLRFAANGDVFAAETGPPVAVKRFTAKGKFLGVVGLPKFDAGCVRASVEVSPDNRRLYVMDPTSSSIHVLEPK